MPYEATCPKGHRLQVLEAHLGERVSCPTCGEAFVVPDLSKGPPALVPNYAPTIKPAHNSKRWKASLDAVAGLTNHSLWVGRPMVALGLILVLLARGCDSISQRAADHADAKLQAEQDRFDDKWKSKEIELAGQIDALAEKKDLTADEQKNLVALRKNKVELVADESKERKKETEGDWRTLEIAAKAAKVNNKINGYWRDIFFVFASVVLSLGLLVVSWSAEGAERWVTLIMLAIITFSLFIGGTAWMPNLH